MNKENNDLPIFTYTTTTIPSTLSNKITRRINVDPINSERPFTSTAKPYNPYSLHITKVTSTAAPFKINYVENLQLKKNVQDSFLDEPKVNRSKTNSLVTNPTTVNHLSFNLNSRFSEDLSSIQNSHYFIKNSSQINNNKLAVTHPTTTLQLISSQKSFDKPTHQHEQNLQNFQQTTKIEVPQRFNHLTQKYEKVIQHQNNSQIEPYDLQNESSKVFAPRQNLFNLQNKSLSNPSSISIQSVLPVHQAQLFAPRGFVQNQAFEETFKTISRSDINTPSSLKKFSTLVPRDAYFPTTFKPSVSFKESFVDPIKQDRLKTTPLSTTPIVVRATRTTTTGKPFLEHDIVDSEDGQYHPEIYEKSFYRNKVKPYNNLQKKTTRKPIFNSGEDELLKAEHSQNIAAGANDLLLEKRKQQAGKLSEFISSANEASPRPFSKPKILMTTQKTVTSTTSPKTTNSDTYDYQYYDSDSHSSHNEYTEYGLNEDFVKTIKKT